MYREKRGPLNVGMRLEQLHAMSDFRALQMNGVKVPFDQLVRYHDADEPQEVTLEDIARRFGVPYEVRKNGST